MKTFLEYVADDIVAKYGTDLSRIAVVFPNKRAELFLNDYIVQAAKRRDTTDGRGVAMWSPAYMTISDLFRRHCRLQVTTNKVLLVCKLYKVFVRHTGSNETLDHFFGWGQLLLNDFDDIDKNMADAAKMFDNLRDLHEYDTTDYLTDEQKEALRRFFTTFSDDHDSRLRERFLRLWSNMRDIYTDYRATLSNEGIAYEGMAYRDVVETLLATTDTPLTTQYDTYLFVGFNMLHKTEQQLFRRLRDMGKARFYWDFDRYYTSLGNDNADCCHEAGACTRQYLDIFPNELDSSDADIYDNLSHHSRPLTYIGAPTNEAQARYISQWLRQEQRYNDGRRTAVVLCDETLLPTVVHCLPPEVEKVNITAGMPLALSPLCSFVDCLIALQTAGYSAKQQAFRLFYVKKVLRHPCARLLSDNCSSLCKHLVDNHSYYPTTDELHVDESLSTVFTHSDDNATLLARLRSIVRLMAANGRDKALVDPLTEEALFRVYTLLNSLHTMTVDGDLTVETLTLQRLVRQAMTATTVPFHGEPAEGVQVMGVLETRNLDFDHLLIVSCNEGNMPRSTGDASFIPHTLREYYGLTTADDNAAVYAYYFHRMIQRAADVTILYNNFTSEKRQAEMSRYMLQLMVESGLDIRRQTLSPGQQIGFYRPSVIEKTADMIAAIEKVESHGDNEGQRYISPSSVNRYLRCPLQFYYANVCGLREPDNAEGEIDNRMFGNIFHRAVEYVYKRQREQVTADFIEGCLRDETWIERKVDAAIDCELFGNKEAYTNPPEDVVSRLNGTQLINRQAIIRYVTSLLRTDLLQVPFTILGVEHSIFEPLTIGTPEGGERTINIKGIIDRLDVVTDKETGRRIVRVVDYKTGSADLKNNSMPSVDAIFAEDTAKAKKPEYYRQAMLYALLLSDNPEEIWATEGSEVTFAPALLFIRHAADDPVLKVNEKRITDIRAVADEFRAGMRAVLEEIFDPARPFTPTKKRERCDSCPYFKLCH